MKYIVASIITALTLLFAPAVQADEPDWTIDGPQIVMSTWCGHIYMDFDNRDGDNRVRWFWKAENGQRDTGWIYPGGRKRVWLHDLTPGSRVYMRLFNADPYFWLADTVRKPCENE